METFRVIIDVLNSSYGHKFSDCQTDNLWSCGEFETMGMITDLICGHVKSLRPWV